MTIICCTCHSNLIKRDIKITKLPNFHDHIRILNSAEIYFDSPYLFTLPSKFKEPTSVSNDSNANK